jgi:hypothetical protein
MKKNRRIKAKANVALLVQFDCTAKADDDTPHLKGQENEENKQKNNVTIEK